MHLRTCAHTLAAWPNECIRRHIATGARDWNELRYERWGSVSTGVLEGGGSRWCGFGRWIGRSGHGVGGAERRGRRDAGRGQWPGLIGTAGPRPRHRRQSSSAERGAAADAGADAEAATVVHSEHAQPGWNRGEDDDAGLMGEERERERGRAAGDSSGQNGDRDQKQKDRRGRETQEDRKAPAGRIPEQVVDPCGVDPARAGRAWVVGEAQHRASEGGSIRRLHVDRTLIGAELSQRLLTFDEVGELGQEEQRPGENPAGGESQWVAATRVVAFVSQNSAQGLLIEDRDRPGGDVHPRSEQPRAECLGLRVGDQQRAVQ